MVRKGYAGETHADSSDSSADGATTPESLRHQDSVVGRSGERRFIASTEGDIRAETRGVSSQVPRQVRISGRLRPIWSMSERGMLPRGTHRHYWCWYYRRYYCLCIA